VGLSACLASPAERATWKAPRRATPPHPRPAPGSPPAAVPVGRLASGELVCLPPSLSSRPERPGELPPLLRDGARSEVRRDPGHCGDAPLVRSPVACPERSWSKRWRLGRGGRSLRSDGRPPWRYPPLDPRSDGRASGRPVRARESPGRLGRLELVERSHGVDRSDERGLGGPPVRASGRPVRARESPGRLGRLELVERSQD
jgi:hypothetical protein